MSVLFTAPPAPVAPAAPISPQRAPVAPSAPIPPPVTPIIPRPPVAPVGEDRVVPLKPVVKAMVRSMTEALTIPAFGYNDEIEVTQLSELRRKLKKVAEERGIQLSYMPIILKVKKIRNVN